ncbi:hypothetical protein ACFFQW_28195 [Umezawaea endophytica]|uniref:Uncharacterized protein n=1 Tax=Umezawaea endophytica TaxID=1654476 RepID=A0A9X2VR89_9PSEU|nr:hypothetical protein [Umezawaea endophytica]MCS7480867.1 hypothetical protein [Umezawaea endophytica]
MSEQDLRDCMKQAVWDEPPLDFDPDSFMARAEQLTKRRRALMSVGVATALIIATVATVPAMWVASRDKGVDTAHGVTATSTVPTSVSFPWPPNDEPRKNHTYEQDQPYLESMWINILSPALQRQGADPTSIGVWSPTYQPNGYERDSSVSDVLFGTVSYVGPSGPAVLTTTLAGVGAWEPAPDKFCAIRKAADTTCNATRRPDGSMVVAMEFAGPKSASNGYHLGYRSVHHYRRDGSVVGMESRSNFSGDVAAGNFAIPLTFDQLTDLATNESIALPR